MQLLQIILASSNGAALDYFPWKFRYSWPFSPVGGRLRRYNCRHRPRWRPRYRHAAVPSGIVAEHAAHRNIYPDIGACAPDSEHSSARRGAPLSHTPDVICAWLATLDAAPPPPPKLPAIRLARLDIMRQ